MSKIAVLIGLLGFMLAGLMLAAPANAESHAHSPVRAGWVWIQECGPNPDAASNCQWVLVHPGHGAHR
jgi:hypothetical protein